MKQETDDVLLLKILNNVENFLEPWKRKYIWNYTVLENDTRLSLIYSIYQGVQLLKNLLCFKYSCIYTSKLKN